MLKQHGIAHSYSFKKIPYRKYKSKINIDTDLYEYLFYIRKDVTNKKKHSPQLISMNNLDEHLGNNKLSVSDKVNILETLNINAEKIITEKIQKHKNMQKIKMNDSKKPQIPAMGILDKEEIKKLPKWVKDNLDTAIIIGEKQQIIQIADGRKYHLKNKLNHLSGSQWTFFINSIIKANRYTT